MPLSEMTPKEKKIIDEIREDPLARRRMEDKCRWEAMSWLGVLREWGDPREWEREAKSRE